MKVETKPVVPVFEPVTITVESEEELAFLFDVFGHTYTDMEAAYGLPDGFLMATYCAIKDVCDERNIPYPSKLEMTLKE